MRTVARCIQGEGKGRQERQMKKISDWRKLAGKPQTQSKTTTFLIKSIQAIAELAILEYRTEGVTEIKQKTESIFFARWKRGLLRYTAKLKVGFDLDQLDCSVDDLQKSITISLPTPKVLSCEIYNRKLYKLPLEKAENAPWKYDIIEDFSSDEVLALDDEARDNALSNVNDLYVLDMLQDKNEDGVQEDRLPLLSGLQNRDINRRGLRYAVSAPTAPRPGFGG